MTSLMHHVNNTPFKCDMCNSQINNGIVRDSSYYCNTSCYQNKMFFDNLSQPQSKPVVPQPQSKPQPKPTQDNCRHNGTCATCRNKYDYKFGCVDTGDKWFCSQTCSRVSQSGNNMQYPAVAFPFASTKYTVFPIHVDARAGKLIF